MEIIKELLIGNYPMKETLKNWIKYFSEELKLYRDIIDINNEENIIVDNHPFLLNETALLSSFSNALVRNDINKEINCLLEYSVYNNKNKFQGRADLLVAHKNYNVLIEAKKWQTINLENWYKRNGNYFVDGKILKHLEEVKKQLKNYANAEKEYYKKKKTYLMVMIFEELIWQDNDENYLRDVKAYNSDIDNYYYILLLDKNAIQNNSRGKKRALEVYGLFEPVNEKSNI